MPFSDRNCIGDAMGNIGDFLGKKNKTSKVIKKLEKMKDEAKERKIEMEELNPEKLPEISTLKKLDDKAWREIKVYFRDEKLIKKFRKITKVSTWPELSTMVENNKWLVKAIEKEYKRKKDKNKKKKKNKEKK